MAKDNITLIVSAKDLASGVLGRVKASTVALGVVVGNLASKSAAALMNGMRGMVNGVLEAERANVMLDASLRGAGQYTPQLAKQYRDLASAIQNETAASDEAVKANIAQLVTLGVSADKMGDAVRAVQSLTAVGRDGALAMVAVARAMDGDISAFERFSPEVRQAATLAEKYAAANRMLSAGYAQQQANLKTVGGAWEALKGRMGDAVEDMGNAITQGLRLGKTLDDAQSAVGRFLQSDSWKAFTDRLAAGAGHVADIAKAMDTAGGAEEVARDLGNVILAALKDGADYLGKQIRGALGAGKVAAAGKYWGGATSGMSAKDVATGGLLGSVPFVGPLLAAKFLRGKFSHDKGVESLDDADAEGGEGGNLAAALKRLSETVNKRVQSHNATAGSENNGERLARKQEKELLDIQKALQRERLQKEAELAEENIRAATKLKIKTLEEQIEAAADRERRAKERIAKTEERRANALQQGVGGFVNDRNEKREKKKDIARDIEKTERWVDDKERRMKNGTKLSPKTLQELVDKKDWLQFAKGKVKLNGAANAAEAEKTMQRQLEAQKEKIQQNMLNELKAIKTTLKQALTVD